MKNVANKFSKCIRNFALTMATLQANTACAYLSYEPKMPESVKKLRMYK